MDSNRIVILYVCPNDSCDNYYGSSNMGSLEHKENIAYVPGEGQKSRGFRITCPQCGTPRVKRYARLIDEDEVASATQRAMASTEVKQLLQPTGPPPTTAA